jgi:hypothetical protein
MTVSTAWIINIVIAYPAVQLCSATPSSLSSSSSASSSSSSPSCQGDTVDLIVDNEFYPIHILTRLFEVGMESDVMWCGLCMCTSSTQFNSMNVRSVLPSSLAFIQRLFCDIDNFASLCTSSLTFKDSTVKYYRPILIVYGVHGLLDSLWSIILINGEIDLQKCNTTVVKSSRTKRGMSEVETRLFFSTHSPCNHY